MSHPPSSTPFPSSPDAPPERRRLRAGPLSVEFMQGDLRYVRWGDREVLRRIYAAVRDHDWGTVPGEITELAVEDSGDGFRIGYTSTHRRDDIHFVWRAGIVGTADGVIRFSFEGEARSTFLGNRIGLCVLHPIRECAGAVCRARYTNGTEKTLAFPTLIAPEQPVKWMHDLAGLAHEVAPGIRAELEFAGDTFETEDQRNWIDASFKTYCTPLRMPFPMEIQVGTRIRQEVLLRWIGPLSGGPSSVAPAGRELPTVQVRFLGGTPSRLPALGLCASSDSRVPDERSLARLQALNLAHLRVDVRASDAATSVQLTEQSSDALVAGWRIELALHLDDLSGWASVDAYLESLASHLRSVGTPLARILVFGLGGGHNTSIEALRVAREHLGDLGVPIGSGTNADLYQLNLDRPPGDGDFIGWSMNPQVHAFDNASLAETPEAAGHQLASVRSYYPGRALVVSPITLKPRFNPNATGLPQPVPAGELPAKVDPRQRSLFAAAWTLAMLQAVAEGGAQSVTFFETLGWCGVMENESGSPLPERFPSVAGEVFPLYHVLADVGEFRGGEVIPTATSEPMAIVALLMKAGGKRRLLLANLSGETRSVSLTGFDGIRRYRLLDKGSVERARNSPSDFRARTESFQGQELTLPSHSTVTLDFDET